MLCVRTFCAILIAAALGHGAGPEGASTTVDHTAPVLLNQDPVANVVVRLPGPAPAPDPVRSAAIPKPMPAPEAALEAPPAALAVPQAATAVLPAGLVRPGQPDDPPRPRLRHVYPPSFEQDSALFCQRLIGQWTDTDARFLLGEPARRRPAFDDNHVANGAILAFSDPTGRYKELELDFDAANETLRTVFVYPWNMSWLDARKLWGPNVTATDATKGRKFFSYLNRRLDVLVDSTGKVISFGLY
jgi:hypothetical protein